MPRPTRLTEHRFAASFVSPADRVAFRKALLEFAGGFTELGTPDKVRYIVGLPTARARETLRRLLADFEGRAQAGRIELEDPAVAPDRDEIYFLLPVLRNPEPGGIPRRPLFTNEELWDLRRRLAARFHFRPEVVLVYGEWRNEAGEPVGDDSYLIRVPRRSRSTVSQLRHFIRDHVLAIPNYDQDCIYLSTSWRGELVGRA